MNSLEKTLVDRLDATSRISDAERRRLLTALDHGGPQGAGGDASVDDPDDVPEAPKRDTKRGYAVNHMPDPGTEGGCSESEDLALNSATRKWSRSYVRAIREKDFVARPNCRPALVGWMAFMTSFVRMLTPRRRHTHATRMGIIVDQPILDLLGITPEIELDLTTDGDSLVITPRLLPRTDGRRTARAEARTLKTHAGTFRKLAW